jgi:hypothetical protein
MMIAVSLSLLAYPSVSTGLKPSKGGSLTLHILAGMGFGEFRPDAGGTSEVAVGAMMGMLDGGKQLVGERGGYSTPRSIGMT